MNTSLTISTVVYNSIDFLEKKLAKFYDCGIIDYFIYIPHKGEINELSGVRGKNHIHLFLAPSKNRPTRDFIIELTEVIKGSMPIVPQPFRKSDLGNWLLYTLHNRYYLMSKGLVREFEYRYTDFVSCVCDDFILENIELALGSIKKDDLFIQLCSDANSLRDVASTGLLNSHNAYLANSLVRDKFYGSRRYED